MKSLESFLECTKRHVENPDSTFTISMFFHPAIQNSKIGENNYSIRPVTPAPAPMWRNLGLTTNSITPNWRRQTQAAAFNRCPA